MIFNPQCTSKRLLVRPARTRCREALTSPADLTAGLGEKTRGWATDTNGKDGLWKGEEGGRGREEGKGNGTMFRA